MMSCLTKSAAKACERNQNVSMVLAIMANSCNKMIKMAKYQDKETNLLCARAMTGAIVLYDHIAQPGAFHKKAPIALRACITTLKNGFPQESALMNAIRFSSKNYKDAPASIQDMFD